MVTSIPDMIYQIIIGPLTLLFEFIFSISYKLVGDPGICIIILSIIMNLLALPLYRRADKIQKAEKAKEDELGYGLDHIKKTFNGDERFLILQTYYRQNDYSPVHVLKGSVSLFLQIPFFIAAYKMLSGLSLLSGRSFGPISDLGAPDGLIVIGSLSINLLPILMTAINLISSTVYLKGSGLKGKLQLYGVAAIFLVLLYNSPSGLVFYWTCNNLFSLLKNIIPLDKIFKKKEDDLIPGTKERISFIFCCIYCCLFTGLHIPSQVLSSSVSEFVNMYDMKDPSVYLWWSLALAIGVFFFWPLVVFCLSSGRVRRWLCLFSVIGAVLFTADYYFFGKEYGTMSSALTFYIAEMDSMLYLILGMTVLLLISVVVIAFGKYILKIVPYLSFSAILIVSVFSFINLGKISTSYDGMSYISDQLSYAELELDREGKNVVVIMLDRAAGLFVPYCFNERPELQEKFDGFTYYSNTLSFGAHTNIAAPALFGGYEYTPDNMNKRSDEPISEKHDEALKVMPVTFLENGYDVTVCDPSYAGYRYVPDLSIYDGYPDIDTYITDGRYNTMKGDELSEMESIWKRNFFCYSFLRVMPPFLNQILYDDGLYNIPDFYDKYTFVVEDTGAGSISRGYSPDYLDSSTVLENLPDMTSVGDTGNGSFVMLVNYTAHAQVVLSEPEYTHEFSVDNTSYDQAHEDRFEGLDMESYWQMATYEDNMSAYILLGEWFDYLRDQGVYDNTRIIIVADHGYDLGLLGSAQSDDLDAEFYNPVLLVKDFDSEGFTESSEFMTNADTPVIAFDGLIEDPVNPFTGNIISSSYKSDEPLLVSDSHSFDIEYNNGNVFEAGPWYQVDGDVLDIRSWEYAGEW
ncbi:MAG: YidC/Oxa1 family membrane protein insertase [Clostridiales bacterium]|nr:YidC/Oxa1 family membrane protein insertase [Clostridiales bacterium]